MKTITVIVEYYIGTDTFSFEMSDDHTEEDMVWEAKARFSNFEIISITVA